MKKAMIKDILHENTNELIMNVVESVPYVRFVSRLDEAMTKRDMNNAQLSALTGIRPSTISDYVSGNKSVLNKVQVMALMVALRITDMNEIFSIEFDDDTVKQFKEEEKKWIEDGIKPQGVTDIYKKNVMARFE